MGSAAGQEQQQQKNRTLIERMTDEELGGELLLLAKQVGRLSILNE